MALLLTLLSFAVMPNTNDIDIYKSTIITIQQKYIEVELQCRFDSDKYGPVDLSTDGIIVVGSKKPQVENYNDLRKIIEILEARARKPINASYLKYVNDFGLFYLQPNLPQNFKKDDKLFLRYRMNFPEGTVNVPFYIGLVSPLSQERMKVQHEVIIKTKEENYRVSEIYPRGTMPTGYSKLLVQTIDHEQRSFIYGKTTYDSIHNAWPGGGVRKGKSIRYFGVLLSEPLTIQDETLKKVQIDSFGNYEISIEKTFRVNTDRLIHRIPLPTQISSRNFNVNVDVDGDKVPLRYETREDFDLNLNRNTDYVPYTISDIDHKIYPLLRIDPGGLQKELIFNFNNISGKRVKISASIDCEDKESFEEKDLLYYRFKTPTEYNSFNVIYAPKRWNIGTKSQDQSSIKATESKVEIDFESIGLGEKPIICDIKSNIRKTAITFRYIFYLLAIMIIVFFELNKTNIYLKIFMCSCPLILSMASSIVGSIGLIQMLVYTRALIPIAITLVLWGGDSVLNIFRA